LSDVSGALPDALNKRGHAVDRVLPLYRQVREEEKKGHFTLKPTGISLNIPLGQDILTAEVYQTEHGGTLTYFINGEEFFDRSELYALPHREYRDNFSRFLFFQKSVVALLDAMGQPYDLLHLNDWQTGLIPVLLDKGIFGTGRQRRERVLFTIHNLAYQGIYPSRHFYATNLPGMVLQAYPSIEYYGQISLMKAGLMGADQVNTVSPTYAQEILSEEQGCGLEGVLSHLSRPLRGIVNGVDTEVWNPESDPLLPATYSSRSLKGKEACKRSLLKEFHLPYDNSKPLFVMISRMVEQKGFDLLAKAMESLMALPIQIILLGSGQKEYQDLARKWADTWPDRFGLFLGYDSDLSHRIEAGGDFFLMPSRFEPCGLNQLYSLRYGTVPIVNGTGGLLDTVTDLRTSPKNGTGYVMDSYTPESLTDCVSASMQLFSDALLLQKVRQRGMRQDVSWENTAEHYAELYASILDV
jgi:starch synthase